jgi:flagellar L-ring protein precursor FlgH
MKTASKFNFRTIVQGSLLAVLVASAHGGSLWREGITDERGMFADKRAKCVGDILTVVVQETQSFNNTVSTTTNKTNTSNGGVASTLVSQFVTALPKTLLGKAASALGPAMGPKNVTMPAVATSGTGGVNGANTFTGGGAIANSQTIAATAAVQVIDVLPNGNLVIEGLRQISYSKECQFAALHGVVRPYDITPANTVLSSNIANAQIQIVSEGALTDSQKKGWLQTLDDKTSPY